LLDSQFVDKQLHVPGETGTTVGEAIILALGGRSQKEVADLIGEPPSTFSRWVQGKYLPDFPDLAKIERACGRPLGFILHAAGYVDEVASVPDAVAMAPELDDGQRRIIMDVYRGFTDPQP
jgi:transcriptional regulator with XRE-family HTH domain